MQAAETKTRKDAAARFRSSRHLANRIWGSLSTVAIAQLKELTLNQGFDLAAGDLLIIGEKWYVTHGGLLRLAMRKKCIGIRTTPSARFSDVPGKRWVFKAIVYRSRSKAFVGYGDADPSNTSHLMRGSEMRIAETRAVNRALRKAYGIGLCSVEELGNTPRSGEPAADKSSDLTSSNGHGSNGQPKLRDQLCLLIRKHGLDPYQVKRYAADFCGTEELRGASRELVQSFVTALADEAVKDRAALVCKLNSYGHAEAVKS